MGCSCEEDERSSPPLPVTTFLTVTFSSHTHTFSMWCLLLGYEGCPRCDTPGRGRQRWRAPSGVRGSGVCWPPAWRSWRPCPGSAGWAAAGCPAAGSDASLQTQAESPLRPFAHRTRSRTRPVSGLTVLKCLSSRLLPHAGVETRTKEGGFDWTWGRTDYEELSDVFIWTLETWFFSRYWCRSF